MKKFYAVLAMLVATVLWGFAFSAQANGMKHVGALLFVALRSVVGVAALAWVIIVVELLKYRKVSFWGNAETVQARKSLLYGGLFCGLIIGAASTFQQLGLLYVSAGKTGFLTALYIIMVPLLGIFFKRKTPLLLWVAVFAALSGAYLLCGGAGTVGKGEIFILICALLFALHIMVIDHYAPHCDCVRLSCIQFAVATLLTLTASRLSGDPLELEKITASLPFWVFCGVGSSAIAFTLQMAAQKYLHPVTASLIMSLESVFAVVGGYLFLHEKLSLRELCGCTIILFAIILAQIPWKKRGEKNLQTAEEKSNV